MRKEESAFDLYSGVDSWLWIVYGKCSGGFGASEMKHGKTQVRQRNRTFDDDLVSTCTLRKRVTSGRGDAGCTAGPTSCLPSQRVAST